MDSEIEVLTLYNYISNTIFIAFGFVCISSGIIVLYLYLLKCDKKATVIKLLVFIDLWKLFQALNL
jgi:hypothetical protein